MNKTIEGKKELLDSKEWLKKNEMAQYLGVSETQFNTFLNRNPQLRVFMPLGIESNTYRFSKSDINAYIVEIGMRLNDLEGDISCVDNRTLQRIINSEKKALERQSSKVMLKKQWLNKKEMSAYFGISENSLQVFLKSHPAIKVFPASGIKRLSYRFFKDEVNRYVKRCCYYKMEFINAKNGI